MLGPFMKAQSSAVNEGVLNVDKPGGLTSHDVVNHVRRLSGLRRVGHAGTLDPLATGVLLICVGRATRLVEYLVGQPKVYEATVRLGQRTDTYDADGEVVEEKSFAHVTSSLVSEALSQFRGTIQQRPPMFSAIKKGGQPLYKLARQGKEIERPLRRVFIRELVLLRWEPPYIDLRIACSSGTYIRSLAHDLGELLDCGGHIADLRRTAIGDFEVESAVALDELNRENLPDHLQRIDTAVSHLPRLELSESESNRLQHGQRVPRQPHQPQDPLVRVYDPCGRFVGIVAAKEKLWHPRKIFPQEESKKSQQ